MSQPNLEISNVTDGLIDGLPQLDHSLIVEGNDGQKVNVGFVFSAEKKTVIKGDIGTRGEVHMIRVKTDLFPEGFLVYNREDHPNLL